MDNHAHRSTTWPLRSRQGDAAAMPPALLQPLPPSGCPARSPSHTAAPGGSGEPTACGSRVEREPAAPACAAACAPSPGSCHRAPGSPSPRGIQAGTPVTPAPRQGRPARGSSARWARVCSRGHCPGCEGEDTEQPLPQESAMLGRPPRPRCPRNRRLRRPSASRRLREKGTGGSAAAFSAVPGPCSRPVTARTQRCPPC